MLLQKSGKAVFARKDGQRSHEGKRIEHPAGVRGFLRQPGMFPLCPQAVGRQPPSRWSTERGLGPEFQRTRRKGEVSPLKYRVCTIIDGYNFCNMLLFEREISPIVDYEQISARFRG